MLFLWWFGSDVEQLYGRKEFLAIYLLSAFCGGAAFEIWSLAQNPTSVPTSYCLGASGAVTMLLVFGILALALSPVILFVEWRRSRE